MLRRGWGFALALFASCHGSDPGFDVVRVPDTAYASADASARIDGAAVAVAREGGAEAIVACIPELEEPGEEDKVSNEYTSCLLHHEGRFFDTRATQRHRKKDDESKVCCYRRGRAPEEHDEE